MKPRRRPYHATFEIGDDNGSVARAFLRVALDEAIVHEAVKAIMAALVIKPQQMIPQQRQLFLPGQCSKDAIGKRRTRHALVAPGQSPLGSPRGGAESLDHLYCALQHRIQGYFRLQLMAVVNPQYA